MFRRDGLCGLVTGLLLLLFAGQAWAQNASFGLQDVEKLARELAANPFADNQGQVPEILKTISYDDWRDIRFVPEKSLWREEKLPFELQFFHPGLFYDRTVAINVVDKGAPTRLSFDTGAFSYGRNSFAGQMPTDMGYAGFRVHAAINKKSYLDEFLVFLGASYFRAVAKGQHYGLSARGLSVDTAEATGEEFPFFKEFWIVKPGKKDKAITIYALLDSRRVTGAFRFETTPGAETVMDVESVLFLREPVAKLGIAPLTSMFIVGENDRRMNHDWRPELHDSDGLAMHNGNGEWLWRPLNNPPFLRFNAYMDNNPRGFGLVQRDQNFDHYQDDGVFYDKRPSVWIEPIGQWGTGFVQLVEIANLDETFDNIVAFWNPAEPVQAGQELLYSYNMYWGTNPPSQTKLGKVVDTFTGLGGVVGVIRKYYSQRFAVDFSGGDLAMIGKDTKIKPVLETSAGRIEITSVRPQHAINGFRCMFDVVPPDDTQNPINLRLYLEADGRPLTETWIYQWTPPAAGDRHLFNPGHLEKQPGAN